MSQKEERIYTFNQIRDLYQTINICEPVSKDFDCHRYEDSMAVVKRKMEPYRNMFYQISLFVEGEQKIKVNTSDYSMTKGVLFFSPSGNVQSWEIKDDLKGYVMFFSDTFLTDSIQNSKLFSNFPFFSVDATVTINLNSVQFEQISNTYENILQELDSDYVEKFEIIRSLLLILMHQSKRIYFTKEDSESDVMNTQRLIIKKFQLLIGEHFLNLETGKEAKLKLSNEYANELNIHPNYLNQISKKIIGKTASKIIQERAIYEAKILLSQTALTVSEIAFRLGFETNAYFCRFFKKETNLTPSDYRKSPRL